MFYKTNCRICIFLVIQLMAYTLIFTLSGDHKMRTSLNVVIYQNVRFEQDFNNSSILINICMLQGLTSRRHFIYAYTGRRCSLLQGLACCCYKSILGYSDFWTSNAKPNSQLHNPRARHDYLRSAVKLCRIVKNVSDRYCYEPSRPYPTSLCHLDLRWPVVASSLVWSNPQCAVTSQNRHCRVVGGIIR